MSKQVTWFIVGDAPPPLDERFYYMDATDLAFWTSLTGIHDQESLKQHILTIQAKAYKKVPYPCIRNFSFLRTKVSKLPIFEQVQKIGCERPGSILLDIGCCFGNDAREIAYGGFPPCNIVCTDLVLELWDLGHALFLSNADTFPAHFVSGDAFDPSHLSLGPPLLTAKHACVPDLKNLTSLNPLRGHVSVIHASSFIHLFDEEKQLYLARALAGLLSPEPGSVIFGLQVGSPTKGPLSKTLFAESLELTFCHSPESWVDLWDGEVFERGTVKVDARLIQYPDIKEEFHVLLWSVLRL
ncbi:hypothetical protein BJ138DRAFT_1014785 [Hygrophoropsis aurantiaca]|uniref:Uncharacterized protein n=1 Tax=Hygrophoropsis aurantiaca TaxID=72124 RepID=A0ACB8A268_9AGAM|nr:hypothetical protein BJ138DRAFT_1014785 [Hygrophoropsis aurantiaca]